MFRQLAYTRYDPNVINKVSLVNIEKKLKSWSPSIIFTNSMSDTFHESLTIQQITEMFDSMKKYSKHQFIILTKRINKAYNFFKNYGCPDNCWIGTSIENRSAMHRLEKLKQIDCKIRFVSFEPLLENLYQVDLTGIHWAIVGGESDFKDPRPFNEDWAINIRNQCRAYGTAFFYKQFGGSKKIDGCWGTNKIDGKKYLEMPILLATKESTF